MGGPGPYDGGVEGGRESQRLLEGGDGPHRASGRPLQRTKRQTEPTEGKDDSHQAGTKRQNDVTIPLGPRDSATPGSPCCLPGPGRAGEDP